jgi:hypothetical protein
MGIACSTQGEDEKCIQNVIASKPKEKRPFARPKRGLQDITEKDNNICVKECRFD